MLFCLVGAANVFAIVNVDDDRVPLVMCGGTITRTPLSRTAGL